MTKYTNKHGRIQPHARIFTEWMDLPAWRELGCPARALIVELTAKYRPNGHGSNVVPITSRSAAVMLGCCRATASKAIDELEERGWIVAQSVGMQMKGPLAKRAPRYALTTCSPDGKSPAELNFYQYVPHPC